MPLEVVEEDSQQPPTQVDWVVVHTTDDSVRSLKSTSQLQGEGSTSKGSKKGNSSRKKGNNSHNASSFGKSFDIHATDDIVRNDPHDDGHGHAHGSEKPSLLSSVLSGVVNGILMFAFCCVFAQVIAGHHAALELHVSDLP
jgi:hypothetical protein